MSEFDELEAMKAIAAALEPLDDAARSRALQWAVSRFRNSRSLTPAPGQDIAVAAPPSDLDSAVHGSFADLFEAANPNTERDKALVAAYWMQNCEKVPSFAAQSLNTLLKDLGHGIGNITEALTALKNDRPALVLQLKKSGSSRQARKTYKLTTEGAKRVDAMTKDNSIATHAPA